jgi:hypothetical protein
MTLATRWQAFSSPKVGILAEIADALGNTLETLLSTYTHVIALAPAEEKTP